MTAASSEVPVHAAKQVDLFLDALIDAPIKDDRALMEFPFFGLQKQPRMEPIVYEDDRVTIKVSAGERGIATIWDKDVLIYIGSIINDRIERRLPVGRTIRFAAHDLLKTTGRGTGQQAYTLLKDALFRLRSTTITTDIRAGGQSQDTGFGWIDNYRILRRDLANGKSVMLAVEVTLNDWMFRALVQDRRVLSINPAYFNLSSGLERRLYELARKHAGDQSEWKISLARLSRKVGTTRDLRRFKHDLSKVMQRNGLPDYQASLEVDAAGGRPMVVFEPRP